MRSLLLEFRVSRSSYYSFDESKIDPDFEDFKIIEKYFNKHRQKVGIRQLKMIIERCEGLIMNEKKISRIKNKYGLETLIRRKNKYRRFKRNEQEHKTCPNHLDREFNQKKADRVYSIDITQINYNGSKKAYVAAVKDLCTKEIVSKSVSNRIDLKLSNSALDKALRKLSLDERKKLMIHSDQGLHFTHSSFRSRLKKDEVLQSMSRKGNCIDNAPIESFFGHLKDLLELEGCKNIKDIEKEVTRKIKYYNYDRPQLGLKKMPPIEYRRHLNL